MRGRRTRKITTMALGAGAISLLSPPSAHAYLDAGTGSMLLQVLAAGFGGVVVLLKLYGRKLSRLLGWRRSAEAERRPAREP